MAQDKILFIDQSHTLTYSDGRFIQSDAREFTELLSGAIIPLSLLNIHTIKFPNHLNDEELAIQVEIRMFEEGNLNPDNEYTIGFIRHNLITDNSFLCEVFALSHSKSADYFSTALSHLNVIDLVLPGFMIYTAYYNALPETNDLFIYLGEDEAFAAIYQHGTYIAHRTIDTLTTLAVESGLDLTTLKSYLAERGVLEERYSPEEYTKFSLIQERLSRNIERITHTIKHKRGLFGFEGIDHIYLDFEGQNIPGLESIFDDYGIHGIEITPLTQPKSSSTEFHNHLSAKYLASQIHAPLLNLSTFERKARWYKRESGRFLATVILSLVIAIGVPIALLTMISNEEQRKEELTNTLTQLEKETAHLSVILKEQNQHLAKNENTIQMLKKETALIQGAQETADLIGQMNQKRQQFLLDVTSELGRYGLGTLMIEQNGSKEMSIQVISKYQKRDDIAKLMSGLYTRGYQDVQTHEISLDNKMYNAIVKVTR
jgi:hypothetical protein